MKTIKEIGTVGVVVGEDPEAVCVTYVQLAAILTELAEIADKIVTDPISQPHVQSTFKKAGRIMALLPPVNYRPVS